MAVTPETARRLHERRRALLAALGDPQRGLKVVHVAGTNGKGSTVAMMAAVLSASGHRVGRFTSPDLNGPHERFWVDGETIAPEELDRRLATLAPIAEAVAADYPDLEPWRPFELWCQVAWGWFQDMDVDVVVVEAGMGGRSDATNVFETPEVTLVTAIGIDHALWLGHDLPSVARNKAGIFRPGVAAMTTATGEALDALGAEAERVGAPFTAVKPLRGVARPEGGWDLSLEDGPATLALSGSYQLENAALVLAGLDAMRARGWEIPTEAVRRGLSEVAWPGRLEHVTDATGGHWLLDAAHNPAAVAALVSAWRAPEVAVFGVQRTKDGPAMASLLARSVKAIVVVPVPDAESWTAQALGVAGLHEAADLDEAIALAERLAPVGPRAVTGSIYLVGAARARLLRRS